MNETKKHRHRAIRAQRQMRGYSSPVRNDNRQDPRAHGWVEYRDLCRCGAMRRSNVNQCFEEVGPWEEVGP